MYLSVRLHHFLRNRSVASSESEAQTELLSLRGEHQLLHTKIKHLVNERNSLQARLSTSEQSITILEEKSMKAAKKLVETEKSYQKLQSQFSEVSDEMVRRKTTESDYVGKIAGLSQQNSDLISELQTKGQNLADAHLQISTLKNTVTNYEQQLHTLDSNYHDNYSTINAKLLGLQGMNDQLQDKLHSRERESAELVDCKSALESKIISMQAEFESAVESLRADRASLMAQQTALTKQSEENRLTELTKMRYDI